MAIGNAEDLQHALHRTVLAKGAVQRVVDHIRLGLAQLLAKVPAGIDGADPIAPRLQRQGGCLAAHEGHFALGGKPAHQNDDMFFHAATSSASADCPPFLLPTRRISHSS